MKDNSLGINKKLSEAWACQDLWAEYNNCELQEASFVDFEALFGGNKVIASFIFLDNEGFTSTLNGVGADPAEGGLLKIGYTDCLGCKITNEYYITKVNQQTDKKDQKLVHLELIDIASRRMQGTFKAKGYPDTTYNDALTKHLKEINVKIKVIDKKIEQKINMVVSQGKNFFETLVDTTFEKGYQIIHDRAASYVAPKEVLGFDVLKNDGEVFEFETNPIAVNRIVQFKIKGFDSDVLLQNVKSEVQSDDDQSVNSADNKDGVKQATIKAKAKESKNDKQVTKGTKVSETIHQQGTKLLVKPNEEKKYFNSLKDAQQMSIWVPGRNINRVGVKCEVNLPRPKFYAANEYDKVFSGEWETYYVRDKIIGWYFMQEIFLRRPGKG